MIHFLTIESCVTSAFLILSRDPANYVKKTELWDAIDAYSPAIGKDVRSKLMSRALNLPGKTGRWMRAQRLSHRRTHRRLQLIRIVALPC